MAGTVSEAVDCSQCRSASIEPSVNEKRVAVPAAGTCMVRRLEMIVSS